MEGNEQTLDEELDEIMRDMNIIGNKLERNLKSGSELSALELQAALLTVVTDIYGLATRLKEHANA